MGSKEAVQRLNYQNPMAGSGPPAFGQRALITAQGEQSGSWFRDFKRITLDVISLGEHEAWHETEQVLCRHCTAEGIKLRSLSF
jgi:hypothetical protein